MKYTFDDILNPEFIDKSLDETTTHSEPTAGADKNDIVEKLDLIYRVGGKKK